MGQVQCGGGVVAARCDGFGAAGRRPGSQADLRCGRPLPVLRDRHRGGPGHRPGGLRRVRPGPDRVRGAGAGPHRQRKTVHRQIRPASPGRGAVRPDLPQERHRTSADQAPIPHHHRQGGTLAPEHSAGVPRRPAAVRVPRGGAGRRRRLADRIQHHPPAPVPRHGQPGRPVPGHRAQRPAAVVTRRPDPGPAARHRPARAASHRRPRRNRPQTGRRGAGRRGAGRPGGPGLGQPAGRRAAILARPAPRRAAGHSVDRHHHRPRQRRRPAP
jgi:hypothetical protein